MSLEKVIRLVEGEVSNDSIREPSPGYMVDGLTPKVVFYPRDVNELSIMMKNISREGLKVIPMVNRSKLFLGNVPKGYDVALD